MISSLATPKGLRSKSGPGALLQERKVRQGCRFEAERKKFLALVEYFRKYGDKYDVDWLLMEPKDIRNPSSTRPLKARWRHWRDAGHAHHGKELNVGDISDTEANIHAGVKYMRWMIDQYYEKER